MFRQLADFSQLPSYPADTLHGQNIEKAQKEIDRLEAEAKDPQHASTSSNNRRTHDQAKKPAMANQAVNGTTSTTKAELAQEKDAVADDVTEELGKASVEDKEGQS